jgi:hypothetical protein
MDRIETTVNAFREESGKKYVLVLGVVPETLKGQEIEVFYRGKKQTTGFVQAIKTKTLTKVTERDLAVLHRAFVNKEVFWKRVEQAYGGGLPGEFKVTFLTLTEKKSTRGRKKKEALVVEVIEEPEVVEEEAVSIPEAKSYTETPIYNATLKDLLE